MKIKKVFPLLFLILGLTIFAFGRPSWGAGGSSPLLPGGAGFGFWRCDNGMTTEIVLTNVRDYCVLAHLVVLNSCSEEVMNFTIPLAAYDQWIGTLSCQGGRVIIQGRSSWFDPPNNGVGPYEAPSSATYGYISVAITAQSARRSDPRLAPNWKNTTRRLPNALVLNTLVVNPGRGDTLSFPGLMLQDFLNVNPDVVGMAEGDDQLGVIVNHEELLAASRNAASIPGYFALGDPDGVYWAPYNYGATLVLVFPASGIDCVHDPQRQEESQIEIALNVFDHNQNRTSGRARVFEVGILRLGTDITAYDHGKVRLEVERDHEISFPAIGVTPPPHPLAMFGYSVIETVADTVVAPIVPEKRAICDDTNCYTIGVMHQAGTVY